MARSFDFQWPSSMAEVLKAQENGANLGASVFSVLCAFSRMAFLHRSRCLLC
jgi:hypothetical protein